jgi:hypothetical protein
MTIPLQTINVGTNVNDGTGDPIRTAFIKINNNFSSIEAFGPVNSNIKIINNTILVDNNDGSSVVNGDLVLSASSTGAIQVTSSILPSADNVHSLGSPEILFAGGYFGSDGIFCIGNVNIGDTVFTGNLLVSNVFNLAPKTVTESSPGQPGDISWDADYIYVCVVENLWKRVELASF